MAVNNKGQVFIAWVDKRTNPQTIFTVASYDSGKTFGSNRRASDSGFYAYSCDIAADDSGRIYVVWSEAVTQLNLPLRLARSDDSGETFSLRTTVSDLPLDTGQVFALEPSIALGEEGSIAAAWEDKRFSQYTIHFSNSQDYGQTFSPSIRVDDDPDRACCPQTGGASLVWKNGIFYLAFGGVFFGPGDSAISSGVTFKYRPADSDSFVAPVNASAGDGVVALSLALNERGEAFVAWTDNRHDVFFSERYHIFGASGQIRKGDLNLDGLLTVADVVLELNAVFLSQPPPASFDIADGNCDLKLTAADVVLLLRATFLEEPFPCS